MKKRKIIFIIILIVGILSFTSILCFNSKSKTLKSTSKKTSEKKVINKSKNKSLENKNTTKNQTIENKEKSSEKQESSKTDSTNKNSSKKNNSSSSNQSNNNTSQSSNNNSSAQSQNQTTTSQQVQTPPKVQTEWERLGISEYDYYNTPAHNEGELAFKGAISQCTNEKNRLINLYYDKGIDGGREYTVNGEYTHSYLGCGLNIIMNGRSYKYSEIITMEKQGYFNKST